MDKHDKAMSLNDAIQRFEYVLSNPRRICDCEQERSDYTQMLEWLRELARYRELFKRLFDMEDDGSE